MAISSVMFTARPNRCTGIRALVAGVIARFDLIEINQVGAGVDIHEHRRGRR